MTKTYLMAGAILLGATLQSAIAQEPLIDVNLENIRIEIAKNLNIDVENVPITILLPASVAANICGVDVGALGQTGGGESACTATNSTIAMQYVTNTINSGTTTGTAAPPAPPMPAPPAMNQSESGATAGEGAAAGEEGAATQSQ